MPEKNEDGLYPCCADLSNRVLVSTETNPKNNREHVKHEKCGVCNRNHHEMTVEKAFIGVKGK